jgi:4-aminobutyrate aminotransferase
MSVDELKEIFADYFSPVVAKATDLLIERGEGAYLVTTSGERYLDFVQGIAVNALGHSHPALVEAAYEQLKKVIHGSFKLASYPSTLRLAVELRKLTPGNLDMFFFTNSGAESVEGSLKLARYTSRKSGIIAFRGSFHGRTMGAASVTSLNVNVRKNYAPFLPQVYFAPYPYCFRCSFGQVQETCHVECLEYLKEEFRYVIPAEDMAAIIFEPVMGEGGYVVPPVKYVQALRSLCNDLEIDLIFDEVQTGIGRAGKMFACEQFGVVPDILSMGKAIGGGFPLGIVASTRERMTRWEPGAHGTTFGGHPVACAAGLALLKIISEKGFFEEVERKGDLFREGLRALQKRFPGIGDVRGLGLMNAVEIVKGGKAPDAEKAAFLRKYLHDKKILVMGCGTYKNAVRFMPPLNVEDAMIERVLETLEDAFEAIPD